MNGVIYVATRSDAYVLLAEASAKSLRRHAPGLPVTLFTNVLQIPAHITRVFDRVETMPSTKRIGVEWANGLIDKLQGIRSSPYERTLAVRLNLPLNSVDPDLYHLGTKSGCREVFRFYNLIVRRFTCGSGRSRFHKSEPCNR